MTKPEATRLIEQTAASLGEHFSAVQILVSFPASGGGTQGIKRGCGDWYARQGLAHEFITEDQACDMARQIASQLNPPDDEWKQPAP